MDSFMWAFSDSKNDVVDFPVTSNVPDPVDRSKDLSERLDAEENDFADAVLRYINQVLMEDDLEDKDCTIQDSTLHAAEKSLYEILHKEYPSSPNRPLSHEDTSSCSDYGITHCCININSSCINANNLVESGIISDVYKYKSSHVSNPYIESTLLTTSQSFRSPSCSCNTVAGLEESFVNAPLESQSSWKFNGGIEETKMILPSGNSGTFDFDNKLLIPPIAKEKVLKVKGKPEKDEGDFPYSLLRGRKSLHREESDLEEGRSKKHLAVHAEEAVLHELFDKVLSLYCKSDDESAALNTHVTALPNEASGVSHQNERAKGSNGEMTYSKKGVNKRAAVDMRNLLMECMRSLACNDHKTASKLVKQIKLHSSPLGEGYQRLAHYFGNSLEARLIGAGKLDKTLVAKSMSDAEIFKAYKLYLSSFPFTETSFFFATQMIMELAEKETSLHIIDFGIMFGLQWLPLIQRLSTRPGGPPNLRITGIDFPQSGFRPSARAKEAGCRLAKYCEQFNIPFECNGIAQEWETLNVEDLRIEKGEVLVVNTLNQFMYLLDDTTMEHSPRDAVLNLIKRINPNIFIHGVANGTYNSPFLVSRFREALFCFSAYFDMFEANVPAENQDRMVFEREIWGKQILNVIACEGSERVVRPETYKQWHIRTLRAGFIQIPLKQEVMKKAKAKVKSSYHKDFFVDEASQWMLQGWKGRVIFAHSCWKPA